VRDEPSGVIDQIGEHGERLGHQRDACLTAPQALIHGVQAEGRKRLHTPPQGGPNLHSKSRASGPQHQSASMVKPTHGIGTGIEQFFHASDSPLSLSPVRSSWPCSGHRFWAPSERPAHLRLCDGSGPGGAGRLNPRELHGAFTLLFRNRLHSISSSSRPGG
jgi:hypothetical protein